jgi:uncharacterized Tic20 family protein
MSTNTEKSPFTTPVGRAEPMTDLDEQAIKRIKAQKIHRWHLSLLVYLIVNAVLVVSWAVLAATGWSHYVVTGLPQDFFWPIFTIVIWGIFVAITGYVAYRGNAYTEEQIQREMQKLS